MKKNTDKTGERETIDEMIDRALKLGSELFTSVRRQPASAASPTASAASDDAVTTKEMVGPKEAQEMLRHNTRNREVVRMNVRAYVEDMLAGEWPRTHQGIAFGRDGTLYDGQHRLLAVIATGVTVPMMVTRGLGPEALYAIDRGRARRVHEVVAIAEDKHLHPIVRGGIMAAWHMVTYGSLTAGGPRYSPRAQMAAQRDHEGAVNAICAKLGTHRDRLTNAPIVGALAICYRAHPDAAVDFAAKLRDGSNLPEKSPVKALRDYAAFKYVGAGAVSREELALRTFSAFESFMRGESREFVKPNAAARARFLKPWCGEGE
jgi:hypothetical protein